MPSHCCFSPMSTTGSTTSIDESIIENNDITLNPIATEDSLHEMGITPSPHRYIGDHSVGRNADYLVRFPVLSALLDINATEDEICELMAITAIMSDIDDASPFMDTISDADEMEELVSNQADRTEIPENNDTTMSAAFPQLSETPEQPSNSSSQTVQHNERRRRSSRTRARRAHQSFAIEMETQFNQLYQHYFLHTSNDEATLMESGLASTNRNTYQNDHDDDDDDDDLLATQQSQQQQVNSSTQRVIQSLRNHLRFLREIRNRRAALGIQSGYTHSTEAHRLQFDTVRESRQHRRWGMILSRYSFDADMIEARNSNHSATSPLPSHTHWLATSTTPSSPYISDNNQQQQRQQQRQSISNESDDSEYDIHDTIVNDTLEVRGQYRRLQSPEAFRSIVRESNQTRQPHPQSPNVHLLEHRSPSFADIASIRGSLARRFAREQSRLMNNEHNHHHQNASHLSSLFMNTNENNDPFGIFSYDTTHMDDVERQPNNTELWNTIGRMLTASNDDDDDNDEFDYEDLLALSELIGEVRSRGASEYQLAQLKQVTVEEHKRSLDVTTNVDMELYRCTICLDEYAPKEMVNVFPSCNHVFHEICIQQWLTHNQACPLCRCII